MYLGSAWYPEQWPEDRWAMDLKLMREAGMNVVRIGEYAWSRIESREGTFDLDWLERAVNLAADLGVSVVMGTPTDAPPAWLTTRYPETLRVGEDRKCTAHGARRHFSPFSPKYRELSERIVGAMAERFAHHPNVIGWQIGNEFCMYSYDASAGRAFQKWLQKRYVTLDALNEHWTSHYWSEAYTDWSQIPMPQGWSNPGLDLAFFHFMTDGFAAFQRLQIEVIRRHGSTQWITHNIHGWEDLDFTRIIADADVASWDPYPGSAPVHPHRLGWYSDFCRTLKPRPHWIIECQPGHVNWSAPNVALSRGALRAMSWHFYAHGAEAVLYWQWRSGLNGQEQYHGTVIAPDGNPRPVYHEIAQVGRELRKLAPLLEQTRPQARVGLLYSYANQYVLKRQRHHPDFEPLKHTMAWYAAARTLALDVDGVDASYPVDRYPVLLAPHLHLLDDGLVAKLTAYVEAGGHLVLGPRSGFKDEHSAMLPKRQPGAALARLLGAHVDEFYALDRAVEVAGQFPGQTHTWAELLVVDSPQAEVLLRYGRFNGWIDEQPAMVTRRAGIGRITYLATWLDESTLQSAMRWIVESSGMELTLAPLPRAVEACRRVGDGIELLFLINHGPDRHRITLPRAMRQVLGDGTGAAVDLAPYGLAVFATP